MSDITPKKTTLPYLGDDILWKIFAKADGRTIGKCKTINKMWNARLSRPLFAKQHWAETKDKDISVIVGVGYPTSDTNSQWVSRTVIDDGQQIPLNIPVLINRFGYYSVIGSDHSVLCIKFSQEGMESSLWIWNPLTRQLNTVSDEAKKHRIYSVFLYAFGFLHDTMEYRIVHLYKRNYYDRTMAWSLYNSNENDWTQFGLFQSDVKKLGPNCVVDKGIAYWIGWDDQSYTYPTMIGTFALQEKVFHQSRIPLEARTTYHSLTHFNNSVGFISFETVGYSRTVVVWDIKHDHQNQLHWKKLVKISGLGIPYNPTLFVGKNIISIMECRTSYAGANDGERTDVLISRVGYKFAKGKHLMHQSFQENVSVKTVTFHSESLYMV